MTKVKALTTVTIEEVYQNHRKLGKLLKLNWKRQIDQMAKNTHFITTKKKEKK